LSTLDDRTLDAICHALADPTRRALWAQIGRTPGATTAELADHHMSVTRWAVMKHLEVLRRAGLIQTLPEGRRRRHYRDARSLAPLHAWLKAEGG
jgi:predicted transcriptional regulator